MSSQSTEQREGTKGAAGVLDPPSAKPQSDTLEEDRETLLAMFRQMLLIRRFEEKCAESYSLGKIGGFCHLYIGQEAVAVGAISALRPDDYVLTSYREHGQAFASKYKETDQVALCFFGEAAVNQGAFHESLNMAQLWKLPCIYICENNKYGMGTSLERAMSLQNVSEKACAYELASEFVDGMDVLAMRQVTQRAVKRAREQSAPTLIEARTYRFMGHSMSDPGKYRTRAEIEKYQERDPIKLFTATLIENDILTDKGIEEFEAEIKEEIEHAVRFAEDSPEPEPEELYTNVYANPLTKD